MSLKLYYFLHTILTLHIYSAIKWTVTVSLKKIKPQKKKKKKPQMNWMLTKSNCRANACKDEEEGGDELG